jgi:hypothetical protein
MALALEAESLLGGDGQLAAGQERVVGLQLAGQRGQTGQELK